MKSATSSLHKMLNEVQEIFIPDRELFYFDCEDCLEHPDFFPWCDGSEVLWSHSAHLEKIKKWYSDQFKGADEKQMIGEDSTTYLSSEIAPIRIAEECPNVKLIAMLREPVARAYSHYWHLFKTGRATKTFEKTLASDPASLLQRGLYARQLRNYFSRFERERIEIIFFDEFITNPAGVTANVLEFLGLNGTTPPPAPAHENATKIRRWIRMHLLWNKLRRPSRGRCIDRTIQAYPRTSTGWLIRKLDRIYERKLNPMVDSAAAPMNDRTKKILSQYYRRPNADLSAVLERELPETWEY